MRAASCAHPPALQPAPVAAPVGRLPPALPTWPPAPFCQLLAAPAMSRDVALGLAAAGAIAPAIMHARHLVTSEGVRLKESAWDLRRLRSSKISPEPEPPEPLHSNACLRRRIFRNPHAPLDMRRALHLNPLLSDVRLRLLAGSSVLSPAALSIAASGRPDASCMDDPTPDSLPVPLGPSACNKAAPFQ